MKVFKVFMIFGLIVAFAGLAAASDRKAETPAPEAQKLTPDQALTKLKEGNDRFVAGKEKCPDYDPARLALANKESQSKHAYATILSCSDSRVPLEHIFDAGIMDIFVIRIAGNVCNTDEIGSIEYGLAHVLTPVLLVLGHTQCGAVTEVTHAIHGTGHPLERNIPPLVQSIQPAVKRAMSAHPDIHDDKIVPFAIEENVWQAVDNLFMQSPAVRNLVKEGKVKVVGAIYDLETGKVNWLPDSKVADILKSVEANPARATEAMAK